MEFIKLEKKGAVAVVTLGRPPANAFNKQMYLELAEAFRLVQEDKDVRSVLLRADGDRFFSAGNDVKDLADVTPNDPDYTAAVNGGVGAVFTCEKPVVCAVNGVAAGAGFSAVLGSDIVISVESARFGMPEVKVGIVGGTPEASYSLPTALVKYMVLTGNLLPATELYRRGYLYQLVPPEELYGTALAIAVELAKLPPMAVGYTKQSIKNTYQLSRLLDECAPFDRAMSKEHMKHPDAREAQMAFLEKREPHYTGA